MCGAICSREWGKHNSEVCFVGFKDDANLACLVFEFAVKEILLQTEAIRKKLKANGISSQSIKIATDSYTYGFSQGLRENLRRQLAEKIKEDSKYEIMITKPKEVQDYLEGLTSDKHYNLKN